MILKPFLSLGLARETRLLHVCDLPDEIHDEPAKLRKHELLLAVMSKVCPTTVSRIAEKNGEEPP